MKQKIKYGKMVKALLQTLYLLKYVSFLLYLNGVNVWK
jgi:hypothetical protein